MKTKKATGFDLHLANILMAIEEVEKHIVDEDGEKCFNIHTYLGTLTSRLDTILCGNESPTDGFVLMPDQLARYLWCCVALDSGDKPDGNSFRGMPILD